DSLSAWIVAVDRFRCRSPWLRWAVPKPPSILYEIMKHLYPFITLVCMAALAGRAQEVIPLYAGEIPNAKPSEIQEPEGDAPAPFIRVSVFLPLQHFLSDKVEATGQAVVITPGGGYSLIVYGV